MLEHGRPNSGPYWAKLSRHSRAVILEHFRPPSENDNLSRAPWNNVINPEVMSWSKVASNRKWQYYNSRNPLCLFLLCSMRFAPRKVWIAAYVPYSKMADLSARFQDESEHSISQLFWNEVTTPQGGPNPHFENHCSRASISQQNYITSLL